MAAALMVAAAEARAQEQARAGNLRRIVISIPQRRLALLVEGQVIRIYPVAVGAASSPSPTGTYTLVERLANPTWYHPGKVVPPGRDNPLGTRWLGLSRKGYGIHGTNRPRSIGRPVSHGCIRMRNSDVEDLYGLIAVGDTVELHGQRDPELDRIFHPEPVTFASAGGQ
ncbi:MAG TPA: L,D-transpeptidase [Bryobacteraceae bacterium]|jgi:lipoprotein-anchoring transpeptidase ErfK/SrfK|nr:L,D-transpeptidase [Bryobacteraceae bacterium]